MRILLIVSLISLCSTSLAAQQLTTDDPWSLTREVEIVSRWPQGDSLREDRVTADLYRPRAGTRVPAAVIINSSGGVSAHTDHYYARTLARHGMAALAFDSFGAARSASDRGRPAAGVARKILMLAELDDVHRVATCVDYIQRSLDLGEHYRLSEQQGANRRPGPRSPRPHQGRARHIRLWAEVTLAPCPGAPSASGPDLEFSHLV